MIITDIPRIPELPENYIEAAKSSDFVIFVGSGLSMCSGNECPSWMQLAYKILDHIYNKGGINFKEKEDLLTEKNPRRLLSICWHIMKNNPNLSLDKNNWQKIFPINRNRNVYDSLIGFRTPFIMVNYDLNLEYALERAMRSNPRDYNCASKEYDITKPPIDELEYVKSNKMSYCRLTEIVYTNLWPDKILHLHGSIEYPSSIVITMQDYINAYASSRSTSEFRLDFLKTVFEKKCVLFIGTSAAEYEILEFVKIIPNLDHHILMGFYESDIDLANHYARYFEDLGIILIPFSKDIKGQDQVVDILNDWKSVIASVSRPPSKLRDIEEILDGIKL
ncbi:MAG: SIR2 family protein [Candidatus Zixiibacteriota bacterium]